MSKLFNPKVADKETVPAGSFASHEDGKALRDAPPAHDDDAGSEVGKSTTLLPSPRRI